MAEQNREALPRLRPKHWKTSYLRQGNRAKKSALAEELGAPGRLPRGYLQRISSETNVPLPTLKHWRKKILSGLNPFKRKTHPSRALPKAIEDQIYEQIMARIQQRKYTPRAYLRKVAQDLGKPVRPGFKAGRKWMKGFLLRYKLSLRIPHLKRRTAPNDDVVSSFLADFEIAKMQLPRQLILNMDETAWRLNNGRLQTITRTGADEVTVETSLDEKTCLTVICAVCASGRKLPPWVIVKGKTARCEAKYRENPKLRHYIRSHKLVVDHTECGWATAALMNKYIKWMSDQIGGRIGYLLWDLHSSHRDAGVKQKAEKHSINLSFIPAGQTGQWQPLDRRIFGYLKAVAQQQLDEICVDSDLGSLDMADALVVLMESWEKLRPKDIRNAWEHLFMADDLEEEDVAEDPEDEGRSIADESTDDLEEEEEYYELHAEEEDQFVEHSEELPSDLEEEDDWYE